MHPSMAIAPGQYTSLRTGLILHQWNTLDSSMFERVNRLLYQAKITLRWKSRLLLSVSNFLTPRWCTLLFKPRNDWHSWREERTVVLSASKRPSKSICAASVFLDHSYAVWTVHSVAGEHIRYRIGNCSAHKIQQDDYLGPGILINSRNWPNQPVLPPGCRVGACRSYAAQINQAPRWVSTWRHNSGVFG